ncbi:PLP-dependent transferase [Xylariomycetidae sp. FL0641]|nr:PLP-dependent transferase [Xylariomycetidae sp. FL0641]
MSSQIETNGTTEKPLNRAAEVEDLIDAVKSLIIPYIREADHAASTRAAGRIDPDATGTVRNVLVDAQGPEELVKRMRLTLPETEGKGKDGLLDAVQDVLKYSVNTWDQGFMDKLYASTNAVGVVSELLLSSLNTNLHVYQVSPALSVIEKTTARSLAALFGYTGPRAGGVTCQGGSASNMTSLIVARNTLFPETKTDGNGGHRFAVFTSAHGHYSVEKAAGTAGMGSGAVVKVGVDAQGRMDPSALRAAVLEAKEQGKTPLYVNATAGTTVLGSFDPFGAIADVCDEFGLWMHVDGSWGAPVVFSNSAARRESRLAGITRARSITINPHKMLNVPVTCSFLLVPDVALLHRANTLPAGYLFHNSGGAGDDGDHYWDLADLTLQCGRRGDALKLALAWIYYGRAGLGAQVDHAFDMATLLATRIAEAPDFALVSENPPPCLQVCFYYAPGGVLSEDKDQNTKTTSQMVARLIQRGFMVDYAPGPKGSFFRIVMNCQTRRGTVGGLVKALGEIGKEVVPSS